MKAAELRDWFAGVAMQGAAAKFMRDDDMAMAAKKAYVIADHLLEARKIRRPRRKKGGR